MKNTYTDAILLRKAELEKDIQIAERFLETAPKGRLRTSETYGIPQFYYVSEETGSRGRYMRKKESTLIHNLAQKEYSVKLVREARKEIHSIDRFLHSNPGRSVEDAIEKVHINKRRFIRPYYLSDEEYEKKWMDEKYNISHYKEEKKIYPTKKGDMVRSKSEAILADMFYDLQIPYRYECELVLNDGSVKYPDFTLLNTEERKVIYHEHFGRLDEDEYRQKNLRKIYEYMKNGIFVGKNLIITHEAEGSPLNVQIIKDCMKELFHK